MLILFVFANFSGFFPLDLIKRDAKLSCYFLCLCLFPLLRSWSISYITMELAVCYLQMKVFVVSLSD